MFVPLRLVVGVLVAPFDFIAAVVVLASWTVYCEDVSKAWVLILTVTHLLGAIPVVVQRVQRSNLPIFPILFFLEMLIIPLLDLSLFIVGLVEVVAVEGCGGGWRFLYYVLETEVAILTVQALLEWPQYQRRLQHSGLIERTGEGVYTEAQ